jgi:hypothetical protein
LAAATVNARLLAGIAFALALAATPASAFGSTPTPAPLTSARAEAIASKTDVFIEQRRAHRGASISAVRKAAGSWEVSLFSRGKDPKQIALAKVAANGTVTEVWDGFQVAWSMARGYPGAFGRSVNSPWIWIPLCIAFLLPFFDWRKPFRWLHFDLLALLGFSVSLAFFNDANLAVSVPISSALLAWLVARLLFIGLRPGARPPPLRLLIPWRWLAVIGLFLVGFRIGLNVVDGNVIDVGYAGVIGADKFSHGREIYGSFPFDNGSGDTYGPLLYLLYVPFEWIWPWQGTWDDLPSAHAVAGFVDVACTALLFLIGRRLRDNALGVVLAYAWLAFPFTVYVTNSGSNDAIPAALVLAAIWLHRQPIARGAFSVAAGLTKFAPLALLPLFAGDGLWDRARTRSARLKGLAAYCLGVLLVVGVTAAVFAPTTDLKSFWDQTLGYQFGRDAPFSVWGFYGGGWRTAQNVVQVATVLLALAAFFIPRRRSIITLAAMAGAIMAAVQLSATYWFYLYLAWVIPLALIAFLGRPALTGLREGWPERPVGVARSTPPAAGPGSG